MITTKDYKKRLNVGDLILYCKGGAQDEDIGYISGIFLDRGYRKYEVIWLKAEDEVKHSLETTISINDMPESYILPIVKI